MTLWIVLASMTAAVLAALAWPLRRAAPAAGRAAHDREVYRDQLAELERDAERGTIGAAEAEAARNELSRRLIAAGGPEVRPETVPAPRMALALLAVPAIAIPLYLSQGSPRLPGVPLQARLDRALETRDFAALVAKVEAQLAAHPGDAEGWRVLANSYRRMERYADAAEATRRLLGLGPTTPRLWTDFGELLTLAGEGIVTADASRAFAEALKLDPGYPKARFFAGLALKQEGKTAEARAAWNALLADSPADAPWLAVLKEEIAAAPDMTAPSQQEAIRGMVDGLEERLKSDSGDLDGWLKLIRSRTVLGEGARARAAYAAAKDAFKDKPEALAALDGLARELSIP